MIILKTIIPTVALSLAAPLAVSGITMESVYTDLSSKRCQTVEVVEETGSSVQKCPGVAGHSLLVEDDDARQSVTVITPNGKKHPLNYWGVITGAFSTVGERAEWRVARRKGKVQPIALIVRVYANENPDSPNQRTSYLAVAKITADRVCVTDKIKGGATANLAARRAADASAAKPCLQ